MGLLEALVEHVSAKSVLLAVPCLLLAYMIMGTMVKPAWQEMKLARLPGARAPKIKSVWPFGKHALVAGPTNVSGSDGLRRSQVWTFSTTVSVHP